MLQKFAITNNTHSIFYIQQHSTGSTIYCTEFTTNPLEATLYSSEQEARSFLSILANQYSYYQDYEVVPVVLAASM